MNAVYLSPVCHLKNMSMSIGGETGIRTPEPVAQLLPFQGSAIDHSAISPANRLSILH